MRNTMRKLPESEIVSDTESVGSNFQMADNIGRPQSDSSIFKNVLHDFSTGSFVPNVPSDFWDYRFWVDVCLEFNKRSGKKYNVNHILEMVRDLQSEFCAQRAAKDMKDEKLWSIFEACPICRAKIPVFPMSLKLPSNASISSGSGSGSKRRRFEYDSGYGDLGSGDDMAKIRKSVFEVMKADLIDARRSTDIFAALGDWVQTANKLSVSVLTEDDSPVEVKASLLEGILASMARIRL